jgi:hypothetical protein
MDRKVDITDVTEGKTVKFSYSVEWYEEPNLLWKDRMNSYAESRFLPSTFEIHWLSIINSFVLVLLLTAFLTIILLRVLKNDFSRYMELDDDGMEEEEVRPTTLSFKLQIQIRWSHPIFYDTLIKTVWLETDSW